MNTTRIYLLIALTVSVFPVSNAEGAPRFEPVSTIVDIPPLTSMRPFSQQINGITIAPIEDSQLGFVGYGSERCAIAVKEIADIGGNWISITPFGRMEDLEDTFIIHDFEIPVVRNESLIRETVRMARQRGLRVAIIPHLYVMNGQWRGEIDFPTEAQWSRWFDAYTEFVLRWARLAASVSADLFSIGVEFKSSTNYRDTEWRQLIAAVRKVYPGPLTYSANWDEVEQVQFWDALDYIGINAFWPLARKPGDGYAIIRAMAEMIADDLEGLSVYYNRPVIFAEMGIKSAKDSALAPWEWPEHLTGLVYDENYQAQAYDAFFDAMRGRSWFAGLFIWKYFADPFDETQESLAGFTPRLKEAEAVLSRHFLMPSHNAFEPIF